MQAASSAPMCVCPIVPLDHQKLDFVEGRILVHGEEENGRSYLMLESTEAKIYAINHTKQMQAFRRAGRLRGNTFVRLQKVFVAGRTKVEVEELGTAEGILGNRGYLRQTARRLLRNGSVPHSENWGGWLGRYQQAVGREVEQLGRDRAEVPLER